MKPIVKENVIIEDVRPCIDGGRFYAKGILGDPIEVSADIFRHGHKPIAAVLKYRRETNRHFRTTPFKFLENDRWAASFTPEHTGMHEYAIEAFTPGEEDHTTVFGPPLKVYVEPPIARYGSWYEMWPRSQGTDPGKSATFDDMARRLPDIKAMGFTVLYLPPIHPIGRTNRKGANNHLKAGPGDPGCPFAIGNEAGGHTAIEPGLGTLHDFDRFSAACKAAGFTLALDLVLNCSPDHPYVKKHPEWFFREKDGTIKFAENPPKKYEDVYPLDLYCEDYQDLWREIKRVCVFWIEHGIEIFRIDNPHTKPVAFWEWLISELHKDHGKVLFFAEAFTKPKMMKRLAKVGFSQSYTYFTWRTAKQELTDYITELTSWPLKDYMRGNLFVNTPDILPSILQTGGRPAFMLRATLAATLLPSWGMYNGFELCENRAVPGREEYLDSEKYQYKVWDWERPGNIKEYIGRLNAIRAKQRALQQYTNIRFHQSGHPDLLFYSKLYKNELILVVVNLNPAAAAAGRIDVPIHLISLPENKAYTVRDLLTGAEYRFCGYWNDVRLDPAEAVAHIFLVIPDRH
ncbi:MAG: DUF3416 domain-containing protein [Chitinivibrionales bacterium]|nr:DUF3416 domain-containing protein [Chitinivibrionales bacterium]